MNKSHLLAIYRDCGCNIIPIGGDTKSPLEAWARWQTERVPVSTLGRWWAGDFEGEGGPWHFEGRIEFAVLTGAQPWHDAPGLVVMDADDAEAMTLVERSCEPTPLRTSTPGGGMHYYYRHPGGPRIPQQLRHTVRGKAYKLDRKADGGYVMTPGSRKRDGGLYCASTPWTPDLLRSLPVWRPDWIVTDEARRPQAPRLDEATAARLRAAVSTVPGRQRVWLARRWLSRQTGTQQGAKADAKAFAIAMAIVHGFGIQPDHAAELLAEWGQRDDHLDVNGRWWPWSERECAHKVRDAARTPYAVPGDRLSEEWGIVAPILAEQIVSKQVNTPGEHPGDRKESICDQQSMIVT